MKKSPWIYVAIVFAFFTQVAGGGSNAPTLAQNAVATKPVGVQASKLSAEPTGGTIQELVAAWSQGVSIEDSLVAKFVGSAEGTRTPNGGKTSLYEGHTDPGNGVHNRGSFSYQFGNEENLSAAESSERQWQKIKGHMQTVEQQAKQLGITLTPWEFANAIDVANQAPLCITASGGYVERLIEARKKGFDEYKTVLHARIWAFWDDSKGGFDAGGLRAYDDISKEESVRRDQDRRMSMIKKALEFAETQGVKGAFKVSGGNSYQPVSDTSAQDKKFREWLSNYSVRGKR
mgnify:CR=1 FL=1